jgi:putative glutamine amidotransferase
MDHEYSARAIPQYERAVELAGGEPVRIPLDQESDFVRRLIDGCNAVLLPGSKADVDPARFRAARSPHTAAADPRRDAVDALLLEDAFRFRKPVLGICYGLQSLNVYRSGSLIQHIPDFLPEEIRTKVNHAAGRNAAVAHTVEIEQDSLLGKILAAGVARNPTTGDDREGLGFSRAENGRQGDGALAPEGRELIVPVNSSHHQSADAIGTGLRVVAHCPDDGIIEALEGTAPDHFILAVQWHPERSVDDDEPSRAIFRALVDGWSQ